MSISVTDEMRAFVEEQVHSGRFANASEYMRDLLRLAQKRQAEERLEALLLAGLESGGPIEVTPEYWEKKRQQLARRFGGAKDNA